MSTSNWARCLQGSRWLPGTTSGQKLHPVSGKHSRGGEDHGRDVPPGLAPLHPGCEGAALSVDKVSLSLELPVGNFCLETEIAVQRALLPIW